MLYWPCRHSRRANLPCRVGTAIKSQETIFFLLHCWHTHAWEEENIRREICTTSVNVWGKQWKTVSSPLLRATQLLSPEKLWDVPLDSFRPFKNLELWIRIKIRYRKCLQSFQTLEQRIRLKIKFWVLQQWESFRQWRLIPDTTWHRNATCRGWLLSKTLQRVKEFDMSSFGMNVLKKVEKTKKGSGDSK